jgi:hypothetical protein
VRRRMWPPIEQPGQRRTVQLLHRRARAAAQLVAVDTGCHEHGGEPYARRPRHVVLQRVAHVRHQMPFELQLVHTGVEPVCRRAPTVDLTVSEHWLYAVDRSECHRDSRPILTFKEHYPRGL